MSESTEENKGAAKWRDEWNKKMLSGKFPPNKPCVCIDFGSSTSGVSVSKDGKIIHMANLGGSAVGCKVETVALFDHDNALVAFGAEVISPCLLRRSVPPFTETLSPFVVQALTRYFDIKTELADQISKNENKPEESPAQPTAQSDDLLPSNNSSSVPQVNDVIVDDDGGFEMVHIIEPVEKKRDVHNTEKEIPNSDPVSSVKEKQLPLQTTHQTPLETVEKESKVETQVQTSDMKTASTYESFLPFMNVWQDLFIRDASYYTNLEVVVCLSMRVFL